MRKYEQLAADIVKNVGGKENVNALAHCITRLRFKLKDEGKADTEAIKGLDGVVTVVQSGGQYQVVIGNAVGEVYDEILLSQGIKATGDKGKKAEEEAPKKPLDLFVDTVSGIFTPVLGVLAASGMLKGMLALLTAFGMVESNSGTYQVLNVLSDAFFFFLPIFLGLTAARKFRMENEFTAMAIGAALVYPSLEVLRAGVPLYEVFGGSIFASPIHIEFLGIPVLLMNYASSVIPIILAIWVAVRVERFFLGVMPTIFKSFGVPFCTLFVMIPLTLLVVGPISTWLGQLVGAAATGIFALSPVLAGLFIGFFWQIFVMFGLHWGLVPVMINNISVLGSDPVVITMFGTTFAQIGVVLAIILRTKDQKLKSIAIPGFISGIFGVTEPAIYGVTLPRKKYFIISCIGGAIGGALMALLDVQLFIFGGLGVFEYPCFINPATNDVSGMYNGMIVSVVSFALGFVMTLPIYKDEEAVTAPVGKVIAEERESVTEEEAAPVTGSGILFSPLTGKLVAMADVPDEVFSSGLLGSGIAVDPSKGRVVAPADATVTTLFPTGHAIGLTTDTGAELLIHIGMDTVKMDGDGFKSYVNQGDRVKAGQCLIEFDIDKIKAAGYSAITPVIVTNKDSFREIVPVQEANIKEQEKLIEVIV